MYFYSPSTRGFYLPSVHDNIPQDAVQVLPQEYEALQAGQREIPARSIVPGPDGYPVLVSQPAPTREQRVAAIERALQQEMDRQATLKGYDSLDSACKYASLPVGAPFQAEGSAYLLWAATVWHDAYAYLARVTAGEVLLPTPQEAVAMMPALVLPA